MNANGAIDFFHFVDSESFARRAVDHGTGGEVEPRAVALAHDRGPREQAARQRACRVGAGAEVVECIEAAADTGDRDPTLEVIEIVRNHAVVRDGRAAPERA